MFDVNMKFMKKKCVLAVGMAVMLMLVTLVVFSVNYGKHKLEKAMPAQSDASWCVFACVSYFTEKAQCVLASQYIDNIADCCVASIPLDPEEREEFLERYLHCFEGVYKDELREFVSEVDRKLDYSMYLDVALLVGMLKDWLFPCYATVEYNMAGCPEHCVVVCGVDFLPGYAGGVDTIYVYYGDPSTGKNDVCTVYWNPGVPEYEFYLWSRY